MTTANPAAAWPHFAPYILSLLRMVAAFVFITSGTTKLFAFPAGVPPDGNTVPLMTQIGFGALLEAVGGFLLLIGLFTRPVAFLLAGEMAVAYFQFHQPNGAWPIQNHGEPAVLFCFIFLWFAAHGAGPWSADHWIAKARPRSRPT